MEDKFKRVLEAIGEIPILYIGVQLMLWAGGILYAEYETTLEYVTASYSSVVLFIGGLIALGVVATKRVLSIVIKSVPKEGNAQVQQEE